MEVYIPNISQIKNWIHKITEETNIINQRRFHAQELRLQKLEETIKIMQKPLK